MSLLHPPSGFPPHLAFCWPLIWVQVLLLRAAVRAAYGRGVHYHWSVSPNGRVFLTSIDWLPSQKTERARLAPPVHFTNRLAAACDGRAFSPACSTPCDGLHDWRDAPAAQQHRSAPSRALNLPLPET